MEQVGVRALKQNASAVIRGVVESGESVEITDRGRPVASIVPRAESRLEQLLASGLARAPLADIRTLNEIDIVHPGVNLSAALEESREGERF